MNTSSPVRKRAFKSLLYGQFARVGKALASPSRLEMLELLAQSERSVEDLARETALSVANASRHLQVLRQAELVTTRRDGVFIRYRLADAEVARLLVVLRTVAERRLAEVDRVVRDFFGERDEFEPVQPAELLARAKKGEVLILDVRPVAEYAAGHIAGAISVPVTELKRRIGELPRGRAYVAYCRGPYCVFADQAVELLKAHGRKAQRLDGGYPEWQVAGLPVQSELPGVAK